MILKQKIKVNFLINSNYFISALINKVSPRIIFSNLKFILSYDTINVCEHYIRILYTNLDPYVK